MNSFLQALQTKNLLGENLMPTHSTSGNPIVDMFFRMGADRQNKDKTELLKLFQSALVDNPQLAIRGLFYNRDIRAGQGERESFRWMLRFLVENYPKFAQKIIQFIPFYGRWDDVLIYLNSPLEDLACDFILSALKRGDKLCAKWMPRENKSLGNFAKILMRKWGLSPKEYRKLLAGNTEVVENLMCKNQWGEIIYEHVPSKASMIYRKAFKKHDEERYSEYLSRIEKGEVKAKSDVLYPHEIVRRYLHERLIKEDIILLQSMWENLPNWIPEELNFLPICDVSGSMIGEPLEVSISLGIYCSERNKSAFKDAFITFSEHPQLQILRGNLGERINQLRTSKWGMNTNLEKVFELIIRQALINKVPQEDFPKVLIIFSDMQFDQCIRQPSSSGFEMIKKFYEENGYKLPQIVFWNLRNSIGIPVKFDQRGTALVSGFSPSIMQRILNGEMNPLGIVLSTLNSERYSQIIL